MGKLSGLFAVSVMGWFSYSVLTIFRENAAPLADYNIEEGYRVYPLLEDGTLMDFHIFLTRDAKIDETKMEADAMITQVPFGWEYEGAVNSLAKKVPTNAYALFSLMGTYHVDLKIPQRLRGNHTIYLHVICTKSGDEAHKQLMPSFPIIITRPLVPEFHKKPTRYLLSDYDGSKIREAYASAFGDIHAHPLPVSSVPALLQIGPVTENRILDIRKLKAKGTNHFCSIQTQTYRFPVHINSLLSPRDEYMPLVDAFPPDIETAERDIVVKLQYKPMSYSFWMFQHQIDASASAVEQMGFSEYDMDSIKMMATGTTPKLLLITYIVLVLHLIFEVLAFASDISFWRQKTSFEGLSPLSLLMGSVNSVIILVYLKDTNETKLVQWLMYARVLIDVWKLSRMFAIGLTPKFPFVNLTRPDSKSDKLDKLEAQSILRLTGALLPIMMYVCAYQLIYVRQKSWYSWMIKSLAVCAYGGGFITMTPQLFRNYRLKSVSHLPWTALTYQAINTFIDDLFSFIIRMPNMHKMSVFRDDIVFVIYHIQRCMYNKPRKQKATSTKATHKKKPDKYD